jgi:uncharacterized protein (DUF952 family)
MRWLYHLLLADEVTTDGTDHAPPSLRSEGFIHCSYLPDVAESARLHFPAGAALRVYQIDPRRLDVPWDEAATPRGPMPHVHGPLARRAIVATLTLAELDGAEDRIAP